DRARGPHDAAAGPMSTPTQTAPLPLFVPRTVIASERQATQLAHRVMAPLRTVGARMLAFADRVVSGWVGQTATRSGGELLPSVSSQRAALGTMPMARPWYETTAEARPVRASVAAQAPLPRVPELVMPPIESAAERGASIPMTTVK